MFDQPLSETTLPQGTIRFRDVGHGPPIVFVHGLLVSGNIWRKVVPHLMRDHRCITPDWPLGSHTVPLNPDADLSPAGVAKMVADFLEALDLRDVTLVGNDSGGAICQIVATKHPERIGRLVLTTCDAFETFPPKLFGYLKWVARIPGAMFVLAKAMSLLPSMARLPLAYGMLTKQRIDADVLASWTAPSAASSGIRRDVGKFMRAVDPAVTIEAAEALRNFRKPTLLAWSTDDSFFPVSLARRLKDVLPNARLELVENARTFVQEDQPERLAHLIASAA
jgi:pimeloyl-ACP methyl ester carboxylesterase